MEEINGRRKNKRNAKQKRLFGNVGYVSFPFFLACVTIHPLPWGVISEKRERIRSKILLSLLHFGSHLALKRHAL